MLYAVSQSNPAPQQPCTSFIYIDIPIRPGEPTDEYAARVGVSADELRQYNNMPDEMKGSLIYVGMRYKVPSEACNDGGILSTEAP
ncbi:MAG: hypothetical protein R2873_34485 [Caldilineaceae bacterium]